MSKLWNKLEKLLFGLFIFLLVFIPLYPKFPLFGVKGTFVAVRLEDIVIALTFLLWGIFLIGSKRWREFLDDKLGQLLMLFFFIGAVSSFSAVYLTHTASFNLALLHTLRRAEFMTLMPFAYSIVKTKKQVMFILATLSAVVMLVNVYAMGQQYLSWPVISTGNSEFSKGLILRLTDGARVNSTFAGHYDLAVFLVMVLVVLVPLVFRLKEWWLKFWSVFLFGFSFLVLVMTAARLSFVAAVLGIGVSLLLAGKKILIIVLIVLAAGALIYPSQLRDRLISTFTINIENSGQRYTANSTRQSEESKLNIPTLSRGVSNPTENISEESTSSVVSSDITPGEPIDTTELGVYRSFQIRTKQEWPRALRGLMKNPLLGTGYSSLGLATDNDLLRSLGEVGLLGTAAFLLILFEVTRRVWRNYHFSDRFLKYFSAGVLSLLFAFLLNSLFIDVFEASKVASLFWMILGVNLGMTKSWGGKVPS